MRQVPGMLESDWSCRSLIRMADNLKGRPMHATIIQVALMMPSPLCPIILWLNLTTGAELERVDILGTHLTLHAISGQC